ncbi:hypothetical protein QQ054_21685 [Oscillatoria amoena NRMC-F 0135]|nr:hypothetical protein [Oscillatoria amoena NRMC-F 0135]
MSSLASLFNSCATLFTVDIYRKLRPDASEKKLVLVGKIATTVVVGLGMLWIPIMPLVSKGGLYEYLQSVQGYLAPPITAVFLLGLFFKRINAQGAFAGLVTGFVLGMLKLLIQALTGGGMLASVPALVWLGNFNFLYFSGVLFFVSIFVVVVVSFMYPRPSEESISGLTYGSLTRKDRDEIRASWNRWDVLGTAAVLAVVLGIYLYFSFWLG